MHLNDEETIEQIKENMYMQCFLGFSSYTNEEPLSAQHFVDVRKRLSLELMTKITDEVAKAHNIHSSLKKEDDEHDDTNHPITNAIDNKLTTTQTNTHQHHDKPPQHDHRNFSSKLRDKHITIKNNN